MASAEVQMRAADDEAMHRGTRESIRPARRVRHRARPVVEAGGQIDRPLELVERCLATQPLLLLRARGVVVDG